MINATVQLAQQRLLALGYSIGKAGVDGVLGPDTKAAIAAFRKATGMPAGDTLTGDTLNALLRAPTPAPPRPNLRPPPDQLNDTPKPSGTGVPRPNLRPAPPPPDQLGSGNTDTRPRLRENAPIGLPSMPVGPDLTAGPPPELRRGFGTSSQPPGTSRDALVAAQLANARQLSGNPGVQFLPGTTFPMIMSNGMASGARTTEALQRGFAPVDQGGMGLGRFPPQSQQMPPPTSAPPQASPDARFSDPQYWQSPMQMPPREAPPQVASQQPPGPAAAPDSGGIGLPGFPPARDMGDLIGTAGSNVNNWLGGLFGAKPANAAPPAQPQPSAPSPTAPALGGPPAPPAVQPSTDVMAEATRRALELQLWNMMLGARVAPQANQPAMSTLSATGSRPTLPLVYP